MKVKLRNSRRSSRTIYDKAGVAVRIGPGETKEVEVNDAHAERLKKNRAFAKSFSADEDEAEEVVQEETIVADEEEGDDGGNKRRRGGRSRRGKR